MTKLSRCAIFSFCFASCKYCLTWRCYIVDVRCVRETWLVVVSLGFSLRKFVTLSHLVRNLSIRHVFLYVEQREALIQLMQFDNRKSELQFPFSDQRSIEMPLVESKYAAVRQSWEPKVPVRRQRTRLCDIFRQYGIESSVGDLCRIEIMRKSV